MLNIYKILENTTVEGPGNRFCIWFQGCKKHCPECFAKETWEFGAGKNYKINELFEMIKNTPNIEGVTFLGGEPFEQSKEIAKLCALIKSLNLSIVCFTGYTTEELKSKKDKNIDAVLNQIDLLIDGGFEKSKFDLSRPWVGSLNQRYIFLTDRYNKNDIEKYKNKIEVRISPAGKVEINGMGDFKKLEKELLQLGKNKSDFVSK